MKITLRAIGHVEREESDRGKLSGSELRARPARLVIKPEFTCALLGLEPGSDIVVLSYFHLSSRDVLQVHPRGDPDRALRGVFATRSPTRPNPIGLTTARIERIEDNVIEVMGLDALDGTPILDIKSSAPSFDTPYSEEEDHA